MDRAIRGDDIVLRLWRPGDGETVGDIVESSRSAFEDWLPNAVEDLADVDAFLGAAAEAHDDGSAHLYAIEEDGRPVGQCSLHDRGEDTAEIGYWLRTDSTGRGLATRAVVALTLAAFASGYSTLVIHCDEANTKSAAVARRAGYVHTGTAPVDPALPRTPAQSGREMTWTLRRPEPR